MSAVTLTVAAVAAAAVQFGCGLRHASSGLSRSPPPRLAANRVLLDFTDASVAPKQWKLGNGQGAPASIDASTVESRGT